ncbi:hypothetical protein BJY01DRAFT_238821 [Aspergillus pseudoustus]|uniref:Xylanolytic transcriptional activator regulatory domain-containing protein n=1 Tax=Aspergillus pseudoustus TaxID=1810923 RepID=A0ABR4J8Y7_9EURO
MTHSKRHETVTKIYGYSHALNYYQQIRHTFTSAATQLLINMKIKSKNPAVNRLHDEIYLLTNDQYQLQPLPQAIDIGLADNLRSEILHRVLNIPSFIGEYNCHWTNPGSTPTPFLAQLLLVITTAASFHYELSIGSTSKHGVHDHETNWIAAAQLWLSSLSTNIRSPQPQDLIATHCLLLIANRANYVEEGYHRECALTAKISPYHREIRRRLWMTIVKLDRQTCVERGMPPTVRKEDFDILSPLNIDDEKLHESDESTPGTSLKTMPPTTYTETSFQAVLYLSLPVRLKTCAFFKESHNDNEEQEQYNFDSVLHSQEELDQALQEVSPRNNPRENPRQQ